MRACRLRAGVVALLLGSTASAFALDTAKIATSALSPDCLEYRVVGICYCLRCGAFGCSVRTSAKIRHYVPDAVVSSYANTGGNPWLEVRPMSLPNPTAAGGGDGTMNQEHENNLQRFKNADAIGHPAGPAFSNFASAFGFTCEGAGTPFMPYLLSTLDTVAWRHNLPESVYPEALTPGIREIGSRTSLDLWGAVYPRGGMQHQTDDHKAGAVGAQRAGDIVTRRGQPHVYQPLLSTPRDGYWPAGELIEGDASTGKWQELTPRLSNTCVVFPHNDPRIQARQGDYALDTLASVFLLSAARAGLSRQHGFLTQERYLDDFLPLIRLRRQVRVGLIAASLALACTSASSQTRYGFQHQGSIIGDDVLYSIGGGRAVTMTGAANMRSIGVGIGWNSNLICGSMDIKTTIQNQLNGLTRGFQQIMSDVIQNATSAVASLPALIIQRADPGLYNLLTNGVLQARLDFDRSKLTCRAMANRLADLAGGQLGWDQIAEGLVLRRAVQSTDAVSAIEEAEESRGNEGVPWVGGNNAGGRDQPPVKIVADVTRAGYNLVNGRDVDDTSPVDASNCGDRLSCETWSSPQDAVDWATRVLGETEQRTCEDCTKTQTSPGVGLTPLIQEEFDSRFGTLQELIDGTVPMTFDNLRDASSSSMPITRGVIEALRDEPDQELLARRLASEVAYSSVVEMALLLQRTLLTGRKEPNVSANDLAQQAIDRESNILDREIRNLNEEWELRRNLMTNSPMAIIQRHGARAAGSGGVYQGDPVRNRLDELERPTPGGNP